MSTHLQKIIMEEILFCLICPAGPTCYSGSYMNSPGILCALCEYKKISSLERSLFPPLRSIILLNACGFAATVLRLPPSRRKHNSSQCSVNCIVEILFKRLYRQVNASIFKLTP